MHRQEVKIIWQAEKVKNPKVREKSIMWRHEIEKHGGREANEWRRR